MFYESDSVKKMRNWTKRGKLTILWKVTLWYAIFMVMISIIIVTVVFLASRKISMKLAKSTLIHQVEAVLDEMYFDDDEFDIDDEDFVDDGVYISIYDSNKQCIAGVIPKRFPLDYEIEVGEVQIIKSEDESWFVYDQVESFELYDNIYVRGILPINSATSEIYIKIYVLIIILPILVLIATIGGFIITRRAFHPIVQMRTLVEQINSGKDLTRRINLKAGKDEIYRLGETFDRMFERLEAAFEREKQFTSDVSHELRTPISVILSQCEYGLEQANSKETQKSLEVIYKQTNKMKHLVQQLLILSRCDQGFKKINIERVSLSDLCMIVIEEMKERASEKQIHITHEIESDIYLDGDETLLLRMLINLISNAVQYTGENGLIKVTLIQDSDLVIGSVKDNGIGIAESEQEKIWLRFYQVNSSRTSSADNTMGLGLSMVKWIVEAHHGTIEVFSTLGKGSEFVFRLPIKYENDNI